MTALTAPTTPTVAPARRVPRRTLVASLWLFVLLCYLYCDVLGLYHSEELAALLDGKAGDIAITQPFLLGAAVLMTIPIGMVLLSRVAPHRVARWGTVAAGAVMTVVQTASLGFGSDLTLHYAYFSAIEIPTTAFLVWYAAARWRVDD